MARILIGSMPTAGHVNPLVPLARALVQRGHEVCWYTGAKHRSKIEASGVRYLPMKRTPDYDEAEVNQHYPARAKLHGVARLKFDMKHVFIDLAVPQLQDIEEIARDFAPDVMLGEPGFIGGVLFSERNGLPMAVVNVLPMGISSRDTAPFGLGLSPLPGLAGQLRNRALNWAMPNVLFRDVQQHWNMTRARAGLPPATEWLMDIGRRVSLYLQPSVPSFEYARSDLPPNVRFIGMIPAAPPPNTETPNFWHELSSGRPVVHVTQGTIANEKPELFAPALAGLANEDVLVIVATGGRSVENLGLRDVPANARISGFLSYPELLPKTSVMITNGGYGGVQMALSAGVPLVVAGATEDKPEVAARVAWSGAGIDLNTATPRPEQVRRAVRELLDRSQYRERAQALQREFARYDAIALGTSYVEQLVRSRSVAA